MITIEEAQEILSAVPVKPAVEKESIHQALSKANGLICIPRGVAEILGGRRIDVRRI